jgi:hypothetical protein
MATGKEDRLLSQLNQSKTALQDNALWSVIKQLINRLKALESLTNSDSGSGGSSVTNITEIIQYLSSGDGDSGGGEESIPIPGNTGLTGPAGATGAQGPPFPAFIFLEQEQAEDILPIPGNTGPTGPTGSTGATGSQAIGFVLQDDPLDPENIIQLINNISGGSGGGFSLIEARAMTSNANEDFINLSGYSEIMVVVSAVTKSVSTTITGRVSTDNGATFLAASGDYLQNATNGIGTADTGILLHATAATAARYATWIIRAFNTVGVKSSTNTAAVPNYIIPTTTALNAIRVLVTSGAMNGGTIYVFGRQ